LKRSIAASIFLAIAASSHAQLLDLDATAAPDSGEAALKLARELEQQRDSIDPDSAIDNNEQAALELRSAWLLFASEAALAGHDAGEPGSELVLLARTMAKLDAETESLAERRTTRDGVAPIDRVLINAAADDLERAVRKLAGEDAQASHRDALRTIRGTMAPIIGRTSSAPASLIDTASIPEGAIDDDTLAALNASLLAIETGRKWTTLSPSAERLEEAIARALPRAPERPGDKDMHTRLSDEFARAITIEDPAKALETLETVGEAASFVPRLRALGGSENNRLAERTIKALSERQGSPTRYAPGTRLSGELIALLEARENLPDEQLLIREVTASFRALVRDLRPIEIASRDAIEKLILDPDASTDPSTLATLRAHRRAIETLQGLKRLSNFLTANQQIIVVEYAAAARRVQAIGRDLITNQSDDPNANAQSVELLRSIIDDADALSSMIRDIPEALEMMPQRGQSIRYRFTDLPRKAMTAWGVAGGNGPGIELRQEMDVLMTAVRLGADAAAARDRSLDPWQGWELSDNTRRLMRDGVEGALDEALRRAVNSSTFDQRALNNLLATRERYGVVFLEGRLLRAPDAPRPSPDPLLEGTLGPEASDAWMSRHTPTIADICRYTEDWADQIRSGDDEEAEAELRRFVARLTAELLDEIRP